MAWTAPRTWVASETVTATLMNIHVRDNLLETAPAKAANKGGLFAATGANAIAQVTPPTLTSGKILRADNSPSVGVSWRELEIIVSLCTAQNWSSNGFYSDNGGDFLYTSSRWGGAQVFFEVVILSNSGGTVYARLYNETAAAEVASSEVSTTSTSFTRLRSGAITLTNGNTYRVELKGSDANQHNLSSARLVFVNA